MTADQLHAWQARHGLSQVAAARFCKVPVQTYRNWVRGRIDVPGPIERLTWYVDRFGLLAEAGEEHHD